MTRDEIIQKFELYIDDTSELSSTETASLFTKIYQKVSAYRPWEATKTAASGTLSTSVPYVSLPSDFAFLTQNYNMTSAGEYGNGPVILVGSSYTPYRVVSWSDRRQYRDQDRIAYIDIANSRLYFAKQPASADTYEFDYHSVPALLTGSSTPWIPERFQDVIYHGMCVDSFVIQQSDKAKSYKSENEKMYKDYLDAMGYWNAQLVQMT